MNIKMAGWTTTTLLAVLACGPGEAPDEAFPEENLSDAWKEYQSTGSADAACSGVRPRDNGPFRGMIALTFDDGPHLERTPQVLATLERHNARATFFMNGKQIRTSAHEDLVKSMVEAGHVIGNHSQNHVNSREVSLDTWKKEVDQTHRKLTSLLADSGKKPAYFRFPYGSASCGTYSATQAFGYHVVGWHIDTADWCFNSTTGGYGYCAKSTFQYVTDSLRGDFVGFALDQIERNHGGILLMHDIMGFTVDHLDALLDAIEQAGYGFTTVADATVFPLLNGATPQKPAFIGTACQTDSQCDYGSGGKRGYCYEYGTDDAGKPIGFCSLACEGYCPDQSGAAPTFCVSGEEPGTGMCVSKADVLNDSCDNIPGTAPQRADRFVGSSAAPARDTTVCLPE